MLEINLFLFSCLVRKFSYSAVSWPKDDTELYTLLPDRPVESPPLSIAKYLFTQLIELEQHGGRRFNMAG